MTKNSDTSPWMRFPDNSKAIKRHNELVLSSVPTADLVAELSKRDGIEFYDTLQKNHELRIETVYYRNRFKYDTDCKILVVRE